MFICSISSSIISSSALSTSAISSSVISMKTTPVLPHYGAAMVFALIVALTLEEILSSSQHWNKNLENLFNLAIVPFIFTFAMILLYNVLKFVGSVP